MKAVVMITTNDDHEPIVELFEDKEHALRMAREKTDEWCEEGWTERISGNGIHCFESKHGDDCFDIQVFEKDIVPTPKPTIKYLLCPGKVTSRVDGQIHHVSTANLIDLYGFASKECTTEEFINHLKEFGARGAMDIKEEDLIRLAPREDGDYSLPNKPTPLNHLTPIDTKWQFPEEAD